MTHILGLSAYFHDSAACLLTDGRITAAAQEERFSRVKGDPAFPAQAVAYCLRHARITARDLAMVVYYERPLLKLDRLLESYLAIAPRGFRSFRAAAPLWLRERLNVEGDIRAALLDYDGPVRFAEHHEAHAASAFFPSPHHEAALLTIDGVGEWATATIGHGSGTALTLTQELRYPDSLGLLYSAFTYHAGFRVNSGEYKLMGLAPYGQPTYVKRIFDEVLSLRDDGSFTMNQRYFDYIGGLTMTSALFADRFDGAARAPESPLTRREMDYARSVQVVCEEIVLRMARTAHRETGAAALCMAGGVALNAVANGRIVREGPFRSVWIQPASGDAGGALGAAYLGWHRLLNGARANSPGADAMQGAFLGPSFDPVEIERALGELGASFERLEESILLDRVAELLAHGQVVGWMDGRMEFGPRALGARSILADPRLAGMQEMLNQKIKFREGFRPFAPSVLSECALECFDLHDESPYMLIVAPVRTNRLSAPGAVREDAQEPKHLRDVHSPWPAITHLDYTARVQTVDAVRAPRFHALLSAFERRTGCPVLVNTSFNVRGEPPVCSPTDAYACFMQTAIDVLVVFPFLLIRADQPGASQAIRWHRPIPLD